MNGSFEALESARYVSLATYRRDGSPVATPLWFAVRDGRGYFMTTAGTGKVRRLRHDPRVTIAPSSARGRIKGALFDGHARLLDAAEEHLGRQAIHGKYGWQAVLVALAARLGGRRQLYYEVLTGSAEVVA